MDTQQFSYTEQDKTQINEKGITTKITDRQLRYFRESFPFAEISAAATPKKGILQLSENEIEKYIKIYEAVAENERVLKFVPASGAASRMFKVLFAFMNEEEKAEELLKTDEYKPVKEFFDNIEKFAFYFELKKLVENNGFDINKNYKQVLKFFLTDRGMNYANLPKALLLFHSYDNAPSRTSVEEHFAEGINYAVSGDKVSLHFTVSEEHLELFKEEIEKLKLKYSSSHNLRFDLDFSTQKSHTDTIAVNMNNEPFRTEDEKLLFRPGGHGALIENLNELNAEIIFVKNIDNVVPDKLKAETFTYKKALAGILADVRNKSFEYLEAMENSSDEKLLKKVSKFIKTNFSFILKNDFEELSEKKQRKYLQNILNRPIRVCGMVKNEGEPGGGPFFIKKPNGEESLQIVEGSQIDPNSSEKQEIIQNATHFNPVDLVLSTKDYKGNSFDLNEFIDPETGFISEKSRNGKKLKALELPGLWNGAMALWNTIFVEVPISTFNPVKTINDLLRVQHQ